MTVEAQRPTGTPGTAPRGPAGPAPEPRGPRPSSPKPNTQKPPAPSPSNGTGQPWPTRPGGPSGPGGPTGPGRADDAVETIADLLRVITLIAADRLADRDPAGRMRLAQGLRTARLALDDLRTPAGFDLPVWPGTEALAASFVRRAD